MLDVIEADGYISENIIDIEIWDGLDYNQKQRLVNVALKELSSKYSKYTIPNEAVYEYASALTVVFNDTYKMQKNGVKQFSVDGLLYTFSGMPDDLNSLIPEIAIKLIGKANKVNLTNRRVGRSVR